MNRKATKRIFIIGILMVISVTAIYQYFQVEKEATLEPYIKLYLHEQGAIVGMDLEQYIKGVVTAEMPASFDIEALKAQAVCARTYAVKKLIEEHSYPQGADLSDDINVCQAYAPVLNFAKDDSNERELAKRIDEAVESTRGEIMLFDSKPIDALYCSTCGGKTESAGAVWGKDISYLHAVKCDDCSKSSHYQNSHTINNEVINKLVGDKGDTLNIKILAQTPSGRLKSLSINGHQLDADTLRKGLNLPSSWIDFHPSVHTTVINTRGYGHGVGLCQYGANGMAQRGKNYHQILKKYYLGIDFYKLSY
ncbi:MAG: stage II sporulation protein D [Syntrophomonas sp.]|nr:stage II sporulation protein D [Syntrophomonas sp.]